MLNLKWSGMVREMSPQRWLTMDFFTMQQFTTHPLIDMHTHVYIQNVFSLIRASICLGSTAPIRYLQDFEDLRLAVSHLRTKYVNGLPFPNIGWFHGKEVSESQRTKDARCNQLETFLRDICAIIYKDAPNPNMPEVAVYVQTFLGCDTCIDAEGKVSLALHDQGNCIGMPHWNFTHQGHTALEEKKEIQLKKAVQLFVYRLFLLPILRSLVDRFIEEVRTGAITGHNQKIEKKQILVILAKIASFISQIQDLVYEGCVDDFHDIAMSTRFNKINGGHTDEEALYYEAICEHVEIEVYVPLRNTISRHLVHGWRHDDVEIQFKMQVRLLIGRDLILTITL